jgi:hypothetical protein
MLTRHHNRLAIAEEQLRSLEARVDEAGLHETFAMAVIDEATQSRDSDAPPIWPWKALMNREVVAHFAQIGDEDAARQALTRIRDIAQEDVFAARLAILQAFHRTEDREAVYQTVGNNPNVPLHARQALRVVSYDLAQGNIDGLARYVEGIPRETERTIGHMMLAPNTDVIRHIRDGYPFISHPVSTPGDHFEFHDGKARVHIAAVLLGAHELHADALATIGELFRPDFVRKETAEYARALLQQGKRDELEGLLAAVTRTADENLSDYRHLLFVIANTTHSDEDIDRFGQSIIRSVRNPFLRALFLENLVQLHAARGDIESAEGVMGAIEAIDSSYTGNSQSLAELGLFRAYLISGDTAKAESAYRSATLYSRSAMVEARLMYARYLRNGHPGSLRLTF